MIRAQTSLLEEIAVDNFAGGGGASTGVELASGRPVEIAINHDPDAILMHQTNHPFTQHYCESVWAVNPPKVCGGRPVGLAWFSPDCKHFSKAKGGKPVDKNIRGLAWIVLRWAGTVRPRVIVLENVEEFQKWGPVKRGKPVKSKAGQTFRKFVEQLRDVGYDVEWNELVAADYGAPTSRKRFFLIARCDGKAIVWPEATHAPADNFEVQTGNKKPWRAAAEIIDWTQPCPSVFATKTEIKERYGKSAVRPLAESTMRRVIRGVDKFVISSARPFIIQCNHTGGFRGQSIVEPLQTVTGKLGYGAVNAALTMCNNENAVGASPDDPIGTITTGGHFAAVEAELTAASILQYHTESDGAYVRGQEVQNPLLTIDAAGRYSLIGASLVKYYGSDQYGQDIGVPTHTTTAKDRLGVGAAFFSKFYDGGYTGAGSSMEDPLHTITAVDHNALAFVNLIKLKGDNLGSEASAPAQTITAGGTHHGLVVTRVARAVPGTPLRNWPKVRDLLNRYCGYAFAEDEVLLLGIEGVWFYISDIGLRMLTPRELYSANGFPSDYIIDTDYLGNAYRKDKQVARCGNAVPPPFAAAIVRANLPEWCDLDIQTMHELRETVSA
jgi:DNA (cytosine-5)-methyltransferase 1